MPLLPPTSPQGDQSDQESDTTAEPQSEPEDFDDQRSDSIASSVAIHEFETGDSDVKGYVPVVAVSESDATPNGIKFDSWKLIYVMVQVGCCCFQSKISKMDFR